MNALEQQITKLYERGLTIKQISRALEMSEFVVRGSLGIQEEGKKPEKVVVEKVVVEKLVEVPNNGAETKLEITKLQVAGRIEAEKIRASKNPVEKPSIEPPDDDAELALAVLRDIGANRNYPAQARVNAAIILLDEKKGRRNLAADITKITGAAQLNEALKSLAARRDAAYAHLDVKEIIVNEPTKNT